MKISMLDTVTGEVVTQETEFTADWFIYGNGSCDCNRAGLFFPDVDEVICLEQQAAFPELADGLSGFCFGNKRFLIVAADGYDGHDLNELNQDYPLELRTRWLTKKQ